MKRKNDISLPGIGLSALLVIFAVLALVVFALLSLSTAQGNLRLAQKTRQATAEYYDAQAQAHGVVAQLRSGEIPPQVVEDEHSYRFACPVGQTQQLLVQVEKGSYKITQWQLATDMEWAPNDNLPVWEGQETE